MAQATSELSQNSIVDLDSYEHCDVIKTNRPIVGILSQEYFGSYQNYGNHKYSYIAASYVKWIESSGGRVVPILLNQPLDYYQNLSRHINGILFPGGGQDLSNSSYASTGQILYSLAREQNQLGNYLPIWGTCLGFELLSILSAGGKDNILTSCSSNDQPLPIKFVNNLDLSRTRIFHNLDFEFKKIITTQNVTINYHKWCLTQDKFQEYGLDNEFDIIATNQDKKGLDFISIIEGKIFPFFGTIFHPEKVNFEFVLRKHHMRIPHDEHSVRFSQFLSNFFISECRKSSNKFDNQDQEQSYLIYNHEPRYTINEENFEQMYFFPIGDEK